MTKASTVTVHIADLQPILDLVEGYLCENGPESAGRYADSRQVEQAVKNVREAMQRRKE